MNVVGNILRVVSTGLANGFFFTAGSLAAKRLAEELGLTTEHDNKETEETPEVEDEPEVLCLS